MLRIEQINITYNHRHILSCDFFRTPDCGICTVYGESGSGKSSLLKSILLNERKFDHYFINNVLVEKANFESMRMKYFASLSQSCAFIDDLTIQDHFRLFENNQCLKKYIEILKLKILLKKYPPQLSGGEKTRVGLALALLQEKPILILDEPTASLDREMAKRVIELIKEYANTHLVIIATHDQEIVQVAKCIYHIEDKCLICDSYPDSDNLDHQNHFLDVDCLKLAFHQKMRLFTHYGKRKKFAYYLMQFLLIISITLTSFGLSKIITPNKNLDNSLNQLCDNELFVYKMADKQIAPAYTNDGFEYPFDNDEIESIEQIEHVDKVNHTISLSLSKNLTLPELDLDINTVKWELTVLDQNDNILVSDKYPTDEMPSLMNVVMSTYIDGKDYSENIKIQTNLLNGVYITYDLAQAMGIDNMKTTDEYYLAFLLVIPKYVGYNDALMMNPNVDHVVEGCRVIGPVEKVKIPISGILEGPNMGVASATTCGFFLPLSYMEEKMEENKADQAIDYRMSHEVFHYVLLEEEKDSDGNIMHCEPYAPNALIVEIDSSVNKKQVINEIEALGFTASGTISSNYLIQFSNNTESNIFLISFTAFALVVIIYFVLKYLNLKNEMQFVHFFEQIGWSKKGSIRLLLEKYMMDAIILYLVCFMISFSYFKISQQFGYFVVSAEYSYVLIMFGLCCLVAFVYPTMLLLVKRKKDD